MPEMKKMNQNIAELYIQTDEWQALFTFKCRQLLLIYQASSQVATGLTAVTSQAG